MAYIYKTTTSIYKWAYITNYSMAYQQLSDQPSKGPSSCPSPCPITRYNYFIQIYDQPNNKLQGCDLEPMPASKVYAFCFTKIKKNVYKLLLIPLLFVPFLNVLIPLLAIYCLIVYYRGLSVFQNNKAKTVDPFASMVYDPNICQNLGKDHYFFQVQLRQLQGFTFNYNDKLKDQLNLRKERGKVKFMVYNSEFWTHYHGFVRYKKYHWLFVIVTTLVAAGADVMWCFIIF